ncbi:MAG: VWA domain-containing protein [Pseudomonadota bacterium]
MRLKKRIGGALLALVFVAPGASGQMLSLTPASEPQVEVEPNDKPSTATVIDPSVELRGELAGRDRDVFRLTLNDTTEHRDVVFEFDSALRVDLCLLEADGTRVKCLRGDTARFDALSLSGEYLLSIAPVSVLDEARPYRLRISRPVPNEGGSEIEPNDRWLDATALGLGAGAYGAIGKGDRDVFALSIPGPRQRWRIEVDGTSVGGVELQTVGGVALQKRSSGQDLNLDALHLPPGDYRLRLNARANLAPENYTIRVIPAPQTETTAVDGLMEAEPNDTKGQAQRLTFAADHVGRLGRGDTDMYRFHLPGHARVRISAKPAVGGAVSLALDGNRVAASTDERPEAAFEDDLLPGEHLLRLRTRTPGAGLYRVHVTLIDPLRTDARLSDIDIQLRGAIAPLSAYVDTGQRRRFAMEVRNSGPTPKDLGVVARSSALDWQLRADASALRLGPGEQRRIAVTLDVLPDARDDIATLLSLGVSDATGATASVTRELGASCETPISGAHPLWPVPDALLGRINAAFSGLGASVVSESRFSAAGIDGIVSRTTGMWLAQPGDYTVDLAGDTALTVLGAIIHPVGSSKTSVQLKDFELQLSNDGQNFFTVLDETLTADLAEQSFVLDQPVPARFARLRMKSSVANDGRAVGFGEFKVIVAETAEDILGQAANIADNALGGFDVYSTPFTGGRCCHETFSTAKADGQFRASNTGYEWVMGFRDNRAARIQRLRWKDQDGRGEDRRALRKVRIAVSTDSPVGPWTDVADWTLTRTTADEATLVLDAPVWARYVRFHAEPLGESTTPLTPRQVQIFEARADDPQASVLGEWGYGHSRGTFEHANAKARAGQTQGPDAGNSAERATVLRLNTLATGDVLVAEDEDWYAVDVPPGANRLTWYLHDAPKRQYAFSVLDASGRAVETEQKQVEDVLEVSAYVTPGRYLLGLEEPPRSIIFAWDTSGSVGPYYDIIDHTMKAFASGVRRGREEVNLVPFNDPEPELMLEAWSGDANEVHSAIVNSDRRFGSSNAESALLLAASELGRRDGTRAVLFITDAETDGLGLTDAMWRQLESARPQVFTFELSSKGKATPQDMMQSYARVNQGHYDLALTPGDLQIGFDRAICRLRRPKPYRVLARADQTNPPADGALEVRLDVDDEPAGRTNGDAVAVILDASGSMYKKLDGQFRYVIARSVLDDLVTNVLPDGIGFALRAFGNRQASQCRTDLEVALGPLDRAAARSVIRSIEPQPYAYTPIAESIANVPSDLADATGRKTVVLVTDGEESCDGDVAAQIEALRALDIDVQLNVIGFDFDADDRESARDTFREWARLGGGKYFDARNDRELAESLTQATGRVVPFEVLDASEQVVATGAANDPAMSLPPGRYRIRFADRAFASEDVSVSSEKTTTLNVRAVD